MRSISATVTKDHLVWILLGDNIGDEVSVSDITPNLVSNGSDYIIYNMISFGVEGSANTFWANGTSWDHWGECTYPTIESKFNTNTEVMRMFGQVATSNSTLYICTIPREDSISSPYIDYTNQVASPEDISQMQQGTNTAFQFPTICHQTDSRKDLDTFDKIEEVEPSIPDSDIEII
jgi:hypothetical protein